MDDLFQIRPKISFIGFAEEQFVRGHPYRGFLMMFLMKMNVIFRWISAVEQVFDDMKTDLTGTIALAH